MWLFKKDDYFKGKIVLETNVERLKQCLINLKTGQLSPSTVLNYYSNIKNWVAQFKSANNASGNREMDKLVKKCEVLIGDIEKELNKRLAKVVSNAAVMAERIEKTTPPINLSTDPNIEARVDEMLDKFANGGKTR